MLLCVRQGCNISNVFYFLLFFPFKFSNVFFSSKKFVTWSKIDKRFKRRPNRVRRNLTTYFIEKFREVKKSNKSVFKGLLLAHEIRIVFLREIFSFSHHSSIYNQIWNIFEKQFCSFDSFSTCLKNSNSYYIIKLGTDFCINIFWEEVIIKFPSNKRHENYILYARGMKEEKSNQNRKIISFFVLNLSLLELHQAHNIHFVYKNVKILSL